jgi:hypothetical protein
MKNKSIHSCWNWILSIASMVTLIVMQACVEEPIKEDVPELVTNLTLTFTPIGGGSVVVVSATDPDGEGVQDIAPERAIMLASGKSYTLSISLINELADPTSPEYDITNEVREEGDEHLFFFAWSNNLFSAPSGNGNFDSRADAIDYDDLDNAGNPIGLKTIWITSLNSGTGTFSVMLKHQPGIKSTTSTSTDGETDLDITFDLSIE